MSTSSASNQIPCPVHQTQCPNEARLVLNERAADSLDHRLYGNGQPGDIHKIMKRQDEMETDLTKRQDEMKTDLGKKIDQLGEKISRITVVVAVLASSTGAGAGWVLKTLLGG